MKYPHVSAFVLALVACTNGITSSGPELTSRARPATTAGGAAHGANISLQIETDRRLGQRSRTVPENERRDRLHRAVSQLGCTVSILSRESNIFRVQCVNTHHFELGSFALSTTARALWRSLGAEIANDHNVTVAVVGHTDRTPVREPANRTCSDANPAVDQRLARVLQANTQATWPLAAPGVEEANAQLSWCRAAALVQSMLQGIQDATSATVQPTDRGRSFAIVGMGESWTRSAPGQLLCRSSGGRYCAAARRIDVFLQFPASDQPVRSQCSTSQRLTLADTLWCWQQLHQSQAVEAELVRGGQPTVRRLLVEGQSTSPHEFVLSSGGQRQRVEDSVINLAGALRR